MIGPNEDAWEVLVSATHKGDESASLGSGLPGVDKRVDDEERVEVQGLLPDDLVRLLAGRDEALAEDREACHVVVDREDRRLCPSKDLSQALVGLGDGRVEARVGAEVGPDDNGRDPVGPPELPGQGLERVHGPADEHEAEAVGGQVPGNLRAHPAGRPRDRGPAPRVGLGDAAQAEGGGACRSLSRLHLAGAAAPAMLVAAVAATDLCFSRAASNSPKRRYRVVTRDESGRAVDFGLVCPLNAFGASLKFLDEKTLLTKEESLLSVFVFDENNTPLCSGRCRIKNKVGSPLEQGLTVILYSLEKEKMGTVKINVKLEESTHERNGSYGSERNSLEIGISSNNIVNKRCNHKNSVDHNISLHSIDESQNISNAEQHDDKEESNSIHNRSIPSGDYCSMSENQGRRSVVYEREVKSNRVRRREFVIPDKVPSNSGGDYRGDAINKEINGDNIRISHKVVKREAIKRNSRNKFQKQVPNSKIRKEIAGNYRNDDNNLKRNQYIDIEEEEEEEEENKNESNSSLSKEIYQPNYENRNLVRSKELNKNYFDKNNCHNQSEFDNRHLWTKKGDNITMQLNPSGNSYCFGTKVDVLKSDILTDVQIIIPSPTQPIPIKRREVIVSLGDRKSVHLKNGSKSDIVQQQQQRQKMEQDALASRIYCETLKQTIREVLLDAIQRTPTPLGKFGDSTVNKEQKNMDSNEISIDKSLKNDNDNKENKSGNTEKLALMKDIGVKATQKDDQQGQSSDNIIPKHIISRNPSQKGVITVTLSRSSSEQENKGTAAQEIKVKDNNRENKKEDITKNEEKDKLHTQESSKNDAISHSESMNEIEHESEGGLTPRLTRDNIENSFKNISKEKEENIQKKTELKQDNSDNKQSNVTDDANATIEDSGSLVVNSEDRNIVYRTSWNEEDDATYSGSGSSSDESVTFGNIIDDDDDSFYRKYVHVDKDELNNK